MYEAALQAIHQARSIVIASHVEPDADTIGSQLGLYWALRGLGKKIRLFNATTPIPSKFGFLPGIEKIQHAVKAPFDLLICVDSGSFARLHLEGEQSVILNLDHHLTNEAYGTINLVQSDAPSASYVVYQLLKFADISIGKQTALALYAALADDTGFFTYGSVHYTMAFEMALALIQAGADAALAARWLKEREPLARFRLKALFYPGVQLRCEGKIAVGIVTQAMMAQSGAVFEHTAGLAEEMRRLGCVQLSILIVERADGIKVSLRSKGEIDVAQIARRYAGGGHRCAAGFESKQQKWESVLEELVAVCGSLKAKESE